MEMIQSYTMEEQATNAWYWKDGTRNTYVVKEVYSSF